LGENACFLVLPPKHWAKMLAFLSPRPIIGRKRNFTSRIA